MQWIVWGWWFIWCKMKPYYYCMIGNYNTDELKAELQAEQDN